MRRWIPATERERERLRERLRSGLLGFRALTATGAVVLDRHSYPAPCELGAAARAVLEAALPVVLTARPLAPSRLAADGWPDPVVGAAPFLGAVVGVPSPAAAVARLADLLGPHGCTGVELRRGPPERLHVVHPDPYAAAPDLLRRWTGLSVRWVVPADAAPAADPDLSDWVRV